MLRGFDFAELGGRYSLGELELPEDLENIGPDTFENCLKLINLPDLSDLYEE